ncbi:MAG: glucosyltransferase [Firmicutes bacterium]|nr:glucosyltransferase [Bacillota bacterium]
MSNIVFFGIPAHGHTNPTLGVVKELISRGHQVWYYSYEMFREKIEAVGAIFVACDDFDVEKKLSPKDGARIGKDLVFSTKILVDITLALDDKVCTDMKRLKPDCIVADSMAVWGKAVAAKLEIPFVSSTTTFAFNKHSAKIMQQELSLIALVRSILDVGKANKEIKRLRKKGYSVRNALELISSDESTHTIVYTSPEFQPCSETFPDNFVFVGPSIRPTSLAIEKTRDKLIYISLGTVNNDQIDFYLQCIEALKDTVYQVILSAGDLISMEALTAAVKELFGGQIPEQISIRRHVDQIAVLQKADVFVSHCGMNSVSESLYFGVPLVMVPQTAEQSGVCERVAQLGAGIKLASTDADSILAAIRTILKDRRYRENAEAVAEGFRRCPGAKGAAEKIESMFHIAASPCIQWQDEG